MAKKTVANLKDAVAAILTGIDLDNVNDLYGSFERAVSTTIQKADIPEASGKQALMLYDKVTDYPATEQMFGSSIVDLHRQGVERQPWDDVYKKPVVQFDRTKQHLRSGTMVTFVYRQGDPIMRVAQTQTDQALNIDPMTSTDGWTASGDASDLALDNTVYWQQPAALRFNLAAAGSLGILTKTLDNALDMTKQQGLGVNFMPTWLPTASVFTGITLRLGSDSTNYYEVAVTTGFVGAFISRDYFLTAFDLAGATVVGSPDITAIQYVQIRLAYNGTAQNNVRLSGLWCSLPCAFEMDYYSPAVFLVDGVVSASITDDDDEILFRTAAYNIYVREAAREVAFNNGGDIGSGLIAGIDEVLEGGTSGKLGLYQQYRGDNPSEELRTVGNWYNDDYGG